MDGDYGIHGHVNVIVLSVTVPNMIIIVQYPVRIRLIIIHSLDVHPDGIVPGILMVNMDIVLVNYYPWNSTLFIGPQKNVVIHIIWAILIVLWRVRHL